MITNLVTAARLVLLAPLYLLLATQEGLAALAVLALAGLTDVIDGRLARGLGQTSALGGMLDLVADRLLTLTVVAGLAAGGFLEGVWLLAGTILVGRDLAVASFGEAAPDLGLRVGAVEKAKITCQFAAFALLMAPQLLGENQPAIGRALLGLAAVLALLTTAAYGVRAARRLRT